MRDDIKDHWLVKHRYQYSGNDQEEFDRKIMALEQRLNTCDLSIDPTEGKINEAQVLDSVHVLFSQVQE